MENKDNISCKVILYGDSGIGKKDIIQCFINNQCIDKIENPSYAFYNEKTLYYKEYKTSITFEILDLEGLEVYPYNIIHGYSDTQIGIFVYDVTCKNSFNSIKDFWYKEIKKRGRKDMVIGLAGNNCHLFEEEQVTEDEGKKYAKEIGAIFQLTSCTHLIGINELFEECGRKFLENNKINKKIH